MALSAGARPKRRSKKVSDPDFVYDFPTDSLFHDALILEQSNPVDPVLFEQSTKSEARSSKSKTRPVTVPGASSPPFVPDADTNPSLSFDQQLQLIKLQKEKLELEVKVLAMSRQERPLENSFADLSTQDARDAIAPGRTKRNIDWPQDFVPSIQDFNRGSGSHFPPAVSLVTLESFVSRLITMAHATSTQKNIAVHIRSYQLFCDHRALQSFPISVKSISLYIAYLVMQKRASGTILNHLSSLTHAHQIAGYELTWSSNYHFQLLLRGTKRFLGQAVARKYAITPSILHAAFDHFNLSLPLHAAMWALFLVAFFTFLRKSNLVPDNPRRISPKVITRASLAFTPVGANIHVSATKTIQCQQRSLDLPIPRVPGSRLCPIFALRRHLSLNPGPVSAPLFSVISGSGLQPITYKQFCAFLSRVISSLQLDPSKFSPHSFRRGGATFAFDCHIPSEIIKLQGDWQSDAYLVYLELSQQQKQRAGQAMADKLQTMFPE